MKLVSLFAGAGGLDIGLHNAGFSTVVVNELEEHACETLRQNKLLGTLNASAFEKWFEEQASQRCYQKASHSELQRIKRRLMGAVGVPNALTQAEIVEGDIVKISTERLLVAAGAKVGEIALIAGGPPCQPFSRAGKRETVETDDGKLFLEFVRVVKEAQPRWFLFENVKGLAQSRTIVPYIACDECGRKHLLPFVDRHSALAGEAKSIECDSCGNEASRLVVSSVPGGSLEIILREFRAIGYSCNYKLLNAADFGVPQSRERLFIVGSRDGEAFAWPQRTHIPAPKLTSNKSQGAFPFDNASRHWRTVRDVLWREGHPEFGELDESKAVIWVKNVVRPHAEPVTWTLNRPSPTVGAHQAAKLAIAPNGVPPEQLERQQWHVKGRRQKDLPPVYVRHAYLSDEELLLLQTFPSTWHLFGTRMQRAFQIGNAVPPVLGEMVGRAILTACQRSVDLRKQDIVCERAA